MNTPIPVRLNQVPILESVIEARFTPNNSITVEDELPSILQNAFGRWKGIERLPHADIPLAVRGQNPDLMYKPVRRIVWDGFFALVSDRALAIVVQQPYPGWAFFYEKAELALTALFGEVTSQVERLATRYINFIENRTDVVFFDLVTVNIETGNIETTNQGKRLRFEVEDSGIISVVQIQQGIRENAEQKEKFSGLLVDIDTIWRDTINDLESTLEKLQEIHEAEKKVFFEVMTEESTNHYGPNYE